MSTGEGSEARSAALEGGVRGGVIAKISGGGVFLDGGMSVIKNVQIVKRGDEEGLGAGMQDLCFIG